MMSTASVNLLLASVVSNLDLLRFGFEGAVEDGFESSSSDAGCS